MNRLIVLCVFLLGRGWMAAAEVSSGLSRRQPDAVQCQRHHRPQQGQEPLLPVPVRGSCGVFTREITAEVAGLIQQIDTSVGGNKDKSMPSSRC